MLRNWLLWTMLLTVTCGAVIGCAGCAPDSGRGGSGGTTEEGKK